MNLISEIKKKLKEKSDKERAKNSVWFFKTGKGQYGEGDIFIGITVPEIRKVANDFYKKFSTKNLKDLKILLSSKVHEERLCALLILVILYQKENLSLNKRKIADFYFQNRNWVNNWDLVDLSAYKILGPEMEKDNDFELKILNLISSKNLWQRRIAILSTFHFIRKGIFIQILKLAEKSIYDEHDLIHKAVGWMLREVGKKDISTLKKFLNSWSDKMPRTMLRYAIEKFPEKQRQKYLSKK